MCICVCVCVCVYIGAGEKRVVWDRESSEGLGQTGASAWTSRPSSMMPDAAAPDAPTARYSVYLLYWYKSTHTDAEALCSYADASTRTPARQASGASSPNPIKVYQRSRGGVSRSEGGGDVSGGVMSRATLLTAACCEASVKMQLGTQFTCFTNA